MPLFTKSGSMPGRSEMIAALLPSLSGASFTEVLHMSKFVAICSQMAELGVFFAAAAILAAGLMGLK